MLNAAADDPERFLAEGRSLLGPGWTAVEAFEDLDDIDEYESEEEELWVTMDLGNAIDDRGLTGEGQYQLIGMDSPMPFLKLGNQIYQGQYTPLIGDEVILGLIRNHDNPHNPSHPPINKTSHRFTFRAVTLLPKDSEGEAEAKTTSKPKPIRNTSKRPTAIDDSASSDAEVEVGEASLSRVPASATPTKSGVSVIEDPSPSSSEGSDFSESRVGRGKGKAKGKGKEAIAAKPRRSGRQKFPAVVIETPEQLQLLDEAEVPLNAQVTLRKEALRGLSIPPDLDVENRTFTRREVDKLRNGQPLPIPRKRGAAKKRATGVDFVVGIEGEQGDADGGGGTWLESRPAGSGPRRAKGKQKEAVSTISAEEGGPDAADVDME